MTLGGRCSFIRAVIFFSFRSNWPPMGNGHNCKTVASDIRSRNSSPTKCHIINANTLSLSSFFLWLGGFDLTDTELGYRSTTDREPYFPICGAPLQRPVQGNYAVGKQVVKPLMPSGATFRTVYHNSHTFHNSISFYISILVLCLCFCARWARTRNCVTNLKNL